MPSSPVALRLRTRTSGAFALLSAVFAARTAFDGRTCTADAPGHVTFARAFARVSRAAATVGSWTLAASGSKGWALPYLAFCRAV